MRLVKYPTSLRPPHQALQRNHRILVNAYTKYMNSRQRFRQLKMVSKINDNNDNNDNNIFQLVSKIDDNNIFHIFAFDIIRYYDKKYTEVIIDSSNLDIVNSKCQHWRLFVMKKIYKNVSYSNNITQNNSKTYNGYEGWDFIKYSPCPHMCSIYDAISPTTQSNEKYILLNQRNHDDRYLYDYDTKLKLEDYLLNQNIKMPLKICSFENMTPEEQYEICSNCAIFISAHGAGCTNIIFTQKNTPLIEINFRKHWYCDPVCDDHYYNKVDVNEKCNGELTCNSHFHKADFHNLCFLLGKKYLEIEAVEYKDGFHTRNPISKKKIFINGSNLIQNINDLLQLENSFTV